ncbi:uncharacterized protein [Ptychodera flava]|uniref:uncharacterized protein n=1 Tax=Ptychodera flava TaxID=63121 RepID=UPI003969C585
MTKQPQPRTYSTSRVRKLMKAPAFALVNFVEDGAISVIPTKRIRGGEAVDLSTVSVLWQDGKEYEAVVMMTDDDKNELLLYEREVAKNFPEGKEEMEERRQAFTARKAVGATASTSSTSKRRGAPMPTTATASTSSTSKRRGAPMPTNATASTSSTSKRRGAPMPTNATASTSSTSKRRGAPMPNATASTSSTSKRRGAPMPTATASTSGRRTLNFTNS